MSEAFKIQVGDEAVTANLYPASRRTGISLILGHGAGVGQSSSFIVSFANALASRGLDVITFNFLYSEAGRKLPDRTDKLELCYRSVIDAVRKHKRLKKNAVAIGGKSMGGRIASQIAAQDVGDLAGLVFLGYPLHPPGKPGELRCKHLASINSPMLFVQGSRDAFGTPEELRPILKKLDAEIYEVNGGDHSFKVPASAGVQQSQIYSEIQDKISAWLQDRL